MEKPPPNPAEAATPCSSDPWPRACPGLVPEGAAPADSDDDDDEEREKDSLS